VTDEALKLRLAIMRDFAVRGAAPSLIAEDPEVVQELIDAHCIVLNDSDEIRMAHPFAGHTTGARVRGGGREWWGNCAWDALGIVAAIGVRGAVVQSNGCVIEADDPDPAVLFHVAVPARKWWDDIATACGTMLLFRSEQAIDEWCAARSRSRGGVVTADVLTELARDWYGTRLDPDWRPHEASERQSVLDRHGLTGPFWSLT
jgi:hypothetical protein